MEISTQTHYDMGKMVSMYSYRFNPIFLYQISDEYKINRFIWSDCFGVCSLTNKQKKHPYQDPKILYTTILRMFKGCETVLDPFCGSGTTLRACEELGLVCHGIEINPDYARLADSMKIGSKQATLVQI
jgi:DNA modification methylase